MLYVLFAASASFLVAFKFSTPSKIYILEKRDVVWYFNMFPSVLLVAVHGIAGLLVLYLYHTLTAILMDKLS
ncbi:hypothetical protein BKA63DRAFT_516860, partial [Paraphoma chrysanthemicola]